MTIHRLLIITSICAAFASCKTPKDLAYFEDIRESASGTIAVADYEIKLAPQDELLITVSSEVPDATKQYNQTMFNSISRSELQELAASTESVTSTANTSGSSRVPTYIVSRQGTIDFPVLGAIHVEGMTTDQLAAHIRERVGATVKDPIVKVVLINFKVKVLGEVASPHTIDVTTEKFSVIDALAACGDLSDYGKRDNVIVMREQPDGSMAYGRINLHDTALFSSPYYYLQQNDIIYVEPNAIKQDNSKFNQNSSFKLSAVSTVVSVASIIASLVIALTVK